MYFQWNFDDFGFRMDVMGQGGTSFIKTDFPTTEDFSGEPVHGIFIERKTESTIFCTLMQVFDREPKYKINHLSSTDEIVVGIKEVDKVIDHKVSIAFI